ANRRVHYLCGHGCRAGLSSPWPVWPRALMSSPAMETTSRRAADNAGALQRYRRKARWQPLEYLFWCLPVAAYFAFPNSYLLLTQITIAALFALSLDLIYGYAGILSLGHVAFFGMGAYTVGLLGTWGFGMPVVCLWLAALFAAVLGFLSSF